MKRVMSKKEAKEMALELKDKWEQIVTDAFRFGFLTDDICLGCGKVGCDGCPAGTRTGWDPRLATPKDGDEK